MAWNFEYEPKDMEPAPREKLAKLQDLFPAIKQYIRLTVKIDNPSQNFKLVRSMVFKITLLQHTFYLYVEWK